MSVAERELRCFAAEAPPAISVRAGAQRHGQSLQLYYRLDGELGALRIPAVSRSNRRDELWRHTCAEAFVAPAAAPSYGEFNFSPSGEWAAYQFEDYRNGMQPLETPPPSIVSDYSAQALLISAHCVLPPWLAEASSLRLNLTMVLEDLQGQCTYWALHHPLEKPDFHHRGGFTLAL